MAKRHERRQRVPRMVAAARARAEFALLLREAAEGRSTGITNRGELVAFVVPPSAVEGRPSEDFVRNLGAWRKRLEADGLAEEFADAAFTKQDVRDIHSGRPVDL